MVKFSKVSLSPKNLDPAKMWFISFTATNLLTNKKLRFQFRGEINSFKTQKDKLKEAQKLIAHYEKRIKSGWDPFYQAEMAPLSHMTFSQALDFALSKCNVASKTYLGYKLTVKYFKTAAEKLSLDFHSITEIKRHHIKLLLEEIKKTRKWSNKAYNKNTGYISSILGQLIEWEILEYNPANKIKHLPVTESQKFIPYTDEEKKKIKEALLKYPLFYTYFITLYETGIRPKEILKLKIKDIDLKARLITIIPDMKEENSKTKKIRKVPVNNNILPLLCNLGLHKWPSNYYVFGSPYESGKGNKGSSKCGKYGAMNPDYFKPSLTPIKRDTVTKLWKKLIKDEAGIDKYLYAAKATGADAKILAGISVDALQEMYGHSSKYMTRKYISVLQEVHAKEIIEKSPEF